jgi:DNA topoisomerase-1
MRTDSINLSALALSTCKQVITEQYGDRYSKTRQYKTHTKGAQEAHEAIRPTYMNKQEVSSNKDEQRLYELIWKRTIASQMADVETERTNLEVSISNSKYLFLATGEVVTFDGFSRVYTQSTDDPQEEIRVLPAVALKEQLRLREAQAMQSYTKAPARFSEATLVKRMEELEIGRPSTYHPTVDTIQKVKYVEKVSIPGTKRDITIFTLANGQITERTKAETYGADTQRLVPTDLGYITNDFLVENFPEILNYDFTAQKEQQFDNIAEGKAEWVETVDSFYQTFKPLLSSIPSGKVTGRLLGEDPETGLPVIAKISKIGPCVQIGDASKDKPRFASLKKDQSIFSITLKEALSLFQTALPRTIGVYEGKEIVVNEGKFGPYIRYNNTFASLPKHTDLLAITLEEAIGHIQAKEQSNAPIHQWGEITVLRGRFGDYIHTPQGNYQIPRSINSAEITEEQARTLIAQAPDTKATKRTMYKKSTK